MPSLPSDSSIWDDTPDHDSWVDTRTEAEKLAEAKAVIARIEWWQKWEPDPPVIKEEEEDG